MTCTLPRSLCGVAKDRVTGELIATATYDEGAPPTFVNTFKGPSLPYTAKSSARSTLAKTGEAIDPRLPAFLALVGLMLVVTGARTSSKA